MITTDLKKIEFFFDNYSKQFDEIYDTKTSSRNFLKVLINELLRKSMKTRYFLTLNEVRKYKKKIKILDIGCGPGRYLNDILKLGHDVVGIDVANDMIKLAKNKNKKFKKKAKYIYGDYLKYNFSKKFDFTILMGFFDYVKDSKIVFKKLKKDSKVFVASFPKLYHWLSPQRIIRYFLRKCPLYLYTKKNIQLNLQLGGINKFLIIDNDREYFVIGYCSK